MDPVKEIILNIEEIIDEKIYTSDGMLTDDDYETLYNVYSGYKITTNIQAILVLVNQHDDLNKHGYFTINDDTQDFINSELKEITVTDKCLNVSKVNKLLHSDQNYSVEEFKRKVSYCDNHEEILNVLPYKPIDTEQGDIIFVNLETDKGTLQFTVYNIHNGYYGQEIKIVSQQLNLERFI